ncbi:MAG: DUF2169 domain-containing protein [Pseudomonadota bacterium]|nr:DUF2169 domain-containing protein [Pseudomonadota bacterium]
MSEPDLYNRSGFVASLLPILDRDGAPCRVVIVKASYAIQVGGPLRLAEHPREVRLGDEPWGAPEIPDLRFPGDFCPVKVGTDFILSGHATPPVGQLCQRVDVGIRVADRVKLLRVHGPRQWRRSLLGVVPGPSDPMQATPLSWSRAYGGLDLSRPDAPLEEPRNPVGSGIVRQTDRLIGNPAPQIEAPGEPIGAAGGRFVPVGCAPLGRSFSPRRQAAGTYDTAWIQSGYPARPTDYREEHENCATEDLVFREPLRGGEAVRITGVHAAGPLDFVLPKLRVLVEARIDGATIERRPHLDTVVVDSDGMVLELVWRALFKCPTKMRGRFASVQVQAKGFVQ